jgi:uncharacterized Fe-S center protein
MNEVLFADARMRALEPDQSLPAKFDRLLKTLDLATMVKGRSVAIKMHVGGNLGYTTIHPLFVRILVKQLKEAGAASISIMDGHVGDAAARGYTEQTLGAPLVSCFGSTGKYLYKRKIGFRELKDAYFGGNAWDADVFIDLSHLKGHGMCGFGGAIKNIAMGCVPGRTRGDIHHIQGGIVWNPDLCIHCKKCVEECPHKVNRFDDKGAYHVDWHNCTFCRHCVMICPKSALKDDKTGFEAFQEGLARVAAEFLKHFPADRVLFINSLLNITVYCDCWGFSSPSLVPDIGIMASRNIVAVEQASLDAIKASKLMKEGLPPGRKLSSGKGHLFERIHGKDPYLQIRKLSELGFGEMKYKLEEVR